MNNSLRNNTQPESITRHCEKGEADAAISLLSEQIASSLTICQS
jgi:hypothetical protein